MGGVVEDDKAALGVWQRNGKFQTVYKASQQNVTHPPVPHLPHTHGELWSLSFNLTPPPSHNVAPQRDPG